MRNGEKISISCGFVKVARQQGVEEGVGRYNGREHTGPAGAARPFSCTAVAAANQDDDPVPHSNRERR